MQRHATQVWTVVISCLIATLDVIQPLFLEWRPKFVGALGGAVIYSAIALLVWRGRRWPLYIAGLMPIIPSVTLVLYVSGASLPVQPDAWMLGIYGLQLAASASAILALRA